MKLFTILTTIFLLWIPFLQAQTDVKPRPALDVQKYTYNIRLNDSTDVIRVKAVIEILFKKPVSAFNLDLIEKDTGGKGMTVYKVTSGGKTLKFHQKNNRLSIESVKLQAGETYNFEIDYEGIAKDGLIIGKNIFGDRVFFGDNWPNRARNWLVCIDHPLDKALVEFRVEVPVHYQVIATGKPEKIIDLDNNYRLFVSKTEVPVPTKVMVIGVGRFAVENLGEVNHIPVSTWVYPQNMDAGFYDYAQAVPVLKYFTQVIGPFPFSKLANVQSKTRYGGMENAGNIFYYEQSVTGKRNQENLIAHEIAHQWFGDSATETGWEHLWLSEGFATYFTDLYLEHKYGKKRFEERLKNEREKIIRFSKHWNKPVVDTLTENLIKRLNANSYEKGAWVLHMLRRKIGDKAFWEGIKDYYATFAYKNASTGDLKTVFERVSGKDLSVFFKQWLEQPGHPVLKTSYVQQGNSILMHIKQVQKDFPVFRFPLELELQFTNGTKEKVLVMVTKKDETFTIQTKFPVNEILIDPETGLLFEKAAQ